MTAELFPLLATPPWLLAASNPSISGLIITVSEGLSRVQKYLRGFLWLWRVQAGNLSALILDTPCRETWMVMGSPKGNCDPMGSPLGVLQVVGGGGTGSFPCPSVLVMFLFTVSEVELWCRSFRLANKQQVGCSLGRVFQHKSLQGEGCWQLQWPLDGVTAGFTSRSHPVSLGIWGS